MTKKQSSPKRTLVLPPKNYYPSKAKREENVTIDTAPKALAKTLLQPHEIRRHY